MIRESKLNKKEGIIPLEGKIMVYGTAWCGMSQMVRRYLDRMGVSYDFIDLDYNPGAVNKLKWLTGGYASHPTVVIDGQTLVEPTIEELEWALSRNGYI